MGLFSAKLNVLIRTDPRKLQNSSQNCKIVISQQRQQWETWFHTEGNAGNDGVGGATQGTGPTRGVV